MANNAPPFLKGGHFYISKSKREGVEVMDLVQKLTAMIYNHYGRIGLLVTELIIIGLCTLTWFLLNLLPEPKEVIIWSQCFSCKYKKARNDTFVMLCRQYEKPRWNQFRKPDCPAQKNGYSGCTTLADQYNFAVFKRDEVPQERLN